ncbi:MAG: hypothetical protein JXR65_05355 [Bacteroidales bacterium]|nr:hypothetical protein [Bacteroidales bacterium]
MKNWILLIVLFMGVSTSYAGKKEVFKSKKQAAPLNIDGKLDQPDQDWIFDEKEDVYYLISNDNNNLYVQMKLNNKSTVRKIIAFGFTVWIDPDAKGKNVLGIIYPEGGFKKMMEKNKQEREKGEMQNNEHRQDRLNPDGKPETRQEMIHERIERTNKNLKEGQITGSLKGFDKYGIQDAFFGQGDIEALAQLDDKGDMIYEAVIPLKSIFKNPDKFLKQHELFSLTLETGYFEQDMSNMNRGNMNGGMPGGRGSRMGMRGSMGGGVYLQGMMNATKIKLKRVELNNK